MAQASRRRSREIPSRPSASREGQRVQSFFVTRAPSATARRHRKPCPPVRRGRGRRRGGSGCCGRQVQGPRPPVQDSGADQQVAARARRRAEVSWWTPSAAPRAKRPTRRPIPTIHTSDARPGAPAPHHAVRLRPDAGGPGPAGSGGEADEQFGREQGDRLRAVVAVDEAGLAQRHDDQDHGHDPPAPVRRSSDVCGTVVRPPGRRRRRSATHRRARTSGLRGRRRSGCRQRVLSTPSTLRKRAGHRIGAGVDQGWIHSGS